MATSISTMMHLCLLGVCNAVQVLITVVVGTSFIYFFCCSRVPGILFILLTAVDSITWYITTDIHVFLWVGFYRSRPRRHYNSSPSDVHNVLV